MDGYILVHRKLLDSCVFEDPILLKIWIWCLCKATFRGKDLLVGNQNVHILPGQFVFGKKRTAEMTHIPESTLYRKIKLLEKLDMIELNVNRKFTVITIVNWGIYQKFAADGEPKMNQKWTDNEPIVNQSRTDREPIVDTNNKENKDNKVNKENNKNTIVEPSTTPYIKTIVEYLNECAGTNYKYQTAATQQHIKARLKEGFTVDDFKTVIDVMVEEWGNDTEMKKFLRPQTLFGTKFESYRNRVTEKVIDHPKSDPDPEEEELVGDNW